ncbi:hypothetical protein DB29_00168 [Shouchella clausii]|nr:hypothetical protein DB29_00168 [Shouchella clausii]
MQFNVVGSLYTKAVGKHNQYIICVSLFYDKSKHDVSCSFIKT